MSGKDKKKKSTAVATAKNAVRRTTAVELSAGNEARVKAALAAAKLGGGPGPSSRTAGGTAGRGGGTAGLSGQSAIDHLNRVYCELQAEGFDTRHIEQALKDLGGEAELESALDWLCLHVPPSELPVRFAGAGAGTRDGAEVRVLAKGDPSRPRPQHEWQDAFQAPPPPPPDARPSKPDQEESGRPANDVAKDWIKAYLEADSGSEEDDERGESSASSIDDWELWADPREVERRKAERRKASLPPEVRKGQIAVEFAQARVAAARAKAASDRERQQEAGRMIGQLKQEMARLGMSDEELEAMIASQQQQPEGDGDDGGGGADSGDGGGGGNAPGARAAEGEEEVGGDGGGEAAAAAAGASAGPAAGYSTGGDTGYRSDDESMAAAFGDEMFGEDADVSDASRPPAASASAPTPGGARGGATGSDTEDAGPSFDMDLFSEGGAMDQWAQDTAAAPAKKKKPVPLALAPWGAVPGKPAAGKRQMPARKGAQAMLPETILPKALLQQHCQRQGWPPPKFERLGGGGGGRGGDQGYRYAVLLDTTPPGRGSARRKGGQAAAALGPRKYAMREEDDGSWESVQEAQNAAALWALYDVLDGHAVDELVPPPYSALWNKWDSSGEHLVREQMAGHEADRMAFVQGLVQEQQQQQGAQQRQQEQEEEEGQSVEEEATRWEEAIRSLSLDDRQSAAAASTSLEMRRELAAFRSSEAGRQWMAKRSQLPVVEIRQQVLGALRANDVAIVMGDTGCGKTTQVPQYLLEEATEEGHGGACNIVCTQPRRIAAISVSERVADERGEAAPGDRGSRVGYHVRLDAAVTSSTRLTFCTTGILLRRLASDPVLRGVSHVVVDEVHERTLQGDFLLALLRDLVAVRRARGRPLKLIAMSATMDHALFQDYLGGCPVLTAAGRTFPVEQLFLEDAYEETGYTLEPDSPACLRGGADRAQRSRLQKAAGSASKQKLVQTGWGDDEADIGPLNPYYDTQRYEGYGPRTRRNLARVDELRIDYDLAQELVSHIHHTQDEGAILIFLPGMGEISSLYDRLTGSRDFRDGRDWIIPLHSTVSPAEQRRAFLRPPKGVRKVVLSTNIAETSLTIEDVVFVIDSGKLKERRYDPARGMSLLVEDWVAQASARQRKGRAGRVRPGVCYALYTRHRFENVMKRYQAPEMVRVPLEELVLQIHLLRLGKAADFLSRVLQPPPPRAVEAAVALLQQVGALTQQEQLTPLGHHLAQLPVDARIGKLLLLSCWLGCLSSAATIAACLSYKSPFSAPFEQQDASNVARAKLAAKDSGTLAAGQQSDHLLMAAAFSEWHTALRGPGGRKAARDVARRHFLGEQTLGMLGDMRGQFASMLADIGMVAAKKGGGRGRGRGGDWLDDPKAAWNKHSAQPHVVKAVLCAALQPHVAVMDDRGRSGERPTWTDGTDEVALHPASALHPVLASQFAHPFVVFLEKVKTSRIFLRDCTVVSPMALLLFGNSIEVKHGAGYVQVNGWLKVRAAAQTAVLVKQLRRALEEQLHKKIKKPDLDMDAAAGALMGSMVDLLRHEEETQQWGL